MEISRDDAMVSHRKAEEAIRRLRPHLLVKLAQADLALESRMHLGRRGKRNANSEALESNLVQFRSLNRKGA